MVEPVAETALAHPELIAGRYRYERELGRGAQGRVWLVRDRSDDLPYALKLVTAAAEDQVRTELALLARIAHPNLAAVRELVRFAEALPGCGSPEERSRS